MLTDRRLRVAAIYTVFTHRSHANVILENFLEPYYVNGQRIDPRTTFAIASMWGDQSVPGDFSDSVARAYGIARFETIREALCLGGGKLAVDAVLSIGEGGMYYENALDQVLFPRKRFFDEIVAVMRASGRVVPLYNDKHLSYRWDWAREMYDTAREMNIPFMAGSSLPLADRRPPLELPPGARLAEAVSIHGGDIESYDFHALELLQSVVEARCGGETGTSTVQFLEGAALWRAAEEGRWSTELARAAMAAESSDAADHWRDFEPAPHGILIAYRDGCRAAVLTVGRDTTRWNFACRQRDGGDILAARFYPGPWRNRYLFKALCHAIQEHFLRGKSPYPIERTLLTTGILEAAMRSRGSGGCQVHTPHLELRYAPVDFLRFREMGATWSVIYEGAPEPVSEIDRTALNGR